MSLYAPPAFRLRDAAARRALWRYWERDPLLGLKSAGCSARRATSTAWRAWRAWPP
jgi:hypothetical protein